MNGLWSHMIWSLIRKELVEHGWVFAILMPFTLLGFLLVLAGTTLQEVGSPLDSVRFYGVTLHLIVTLALCNRLVVQEYSGKTQLFLEGLPISRSAMLWTKYLLGFSITNVSMAICFTSALAIAARQEMIDLHFVQIMVGRLFAFVFISSSFFFMMGLLGRYRIPLYLCLFFSLMILKDQSTLDVTQHGPFALLNDQFAFERFVFPISNVIGCLITGAVFVAVTMLMGMVREGSVASLMAEKMSYREKLFATVAIASLGFIGSTLDAKRTPDPYTIPGAQVSKGNGLVAWVARNPSESRITWPLNSRKNLQ